ncbi:MAG TPA: 1,4-alpha-glucan branching protein GlgB [Casimicrobiaceae bacterium]|nr:1,4-alpha-glucan branching protein GlgB [Casimicrobiaceae bacterium]
MSGDRQEPAIAAARADAAARLYDHLGAKVIERDGVSGARFAVWAPNAQRVSVVGDFNGWNGDRHVMRGNPASGVWELFVPSVGEGALYKYEIRSGDGSLLPQKADPVGFGAELRPSTASVVRDTSRFAWSDAGWMAHRARQDPRRMPLSMYEVHLASWRRHDDGRVMSYDELAEALIPYVVGLGFTHVELMPVTEYPHDPSWGYQPIGLFAPTSRFGDPAGFARFVNRCHEAGLGVLLDWVPAHFPVDPHGLAMFDGTALYEHADPRQGLHPDWTTAIFNFGRAEVVDYLVANALFWLDRYHIDGFRVDAVASMLHLDYSRKPGEWVPNEFGGNQNLEAVAFLRRFNEEVYARHPGVITIAEESTTWPGVSHPTYAGGLGFGFKWNMGWMHDVLMYLHQAPAQRRRLHGSVTFGLTYAFAENFVLPLSHDEVVHGKGSLLDKMNGDAWRQFATLRAFYAFMWAYPGKKLLFMGQEFAQRREWDFLAGLDWPALEVAAHRGMQSVVRDCNAHYRRHAALHDGDCVATGFRWIVVDDARHSVFAWLRIDRGPGPPVAVVSNFTPAPHREYRIGLPKPGRWREILNTDSALYGGSDVGNAGEVLARAVPCHGFPYSARITVPPLGTLWFLHDGE